MTLPASAVLTRVRALQDRDPLAALRVGLPAWQAGVTEGRQRIELGLALMAAADAAKQRKQVVAIGERLTGATLTPEQRLRLLGFMTMDIWATGKIASVKALEHDIIALQSQLPGKAADIAELWRRLASSYMILQDWSAGYRSARLAIATAPRHPSRIDYFANQLIAVADVRRGELPQALQAMMAADHAGKALGLPDDPMMLLNFSGLFMYTHNWPGAIAYAQRALAAHPTPQQRISILGNIGGAYEEMNDYPHAMAAYSEALRIAKANGLSAPGVLNNLGDLLQRQHQQAQALPLLQEAATESAHAGDVTDAATIYSNIGAALASLGRHQDAARAYTHSLALFGKADDVQRKLELYPRIVDNLAAMGSYRQALSVMREYMKLYEAHVTVQSKTLITKLQSMIELEQQKAQLAEAQREHTMQQVALAKAKALEQRQRLVVFGMLGMLLLIAAVAAWNIRASRMRMRLNQALAAKNNEIESQHRNLAVLNETIRKQSEEDALTGLSNRRSGQACLERLAAVFVDAQRKGNPVTPVLIVLLDIDHFKQVNDLHGHEAGDRALMHFAEILRDCSRQSDVLARWGGEEFLWICPDTPLSEASSIFNRVAERLHQQPMTLRNGMTRLSVSMGFSLFPLWPQAGGDWAISLRVADAALYRAKLSGRGRWMGFSAGMRISDLAQDPSLREADIDVLETRECLVSLAAAIPSDALSPQAV